MKLKSPRRKGGNGLVVTSVVSTPIVATTSHYLYSIREYLCRRLCADMLFNSEMSRELDRWTDAYESACIEIETLQKRISELEGRD